MTFEQETEDVIKLDLLSEWIPQCVDLTASAREVMGLVEGEGGNGGNKTGPSGGDDEPAMPQRRAERYNRISRLLVTGRLEKNCIYKRVSSFLGTREFKARQIIKWNLPTKVFREKCWG